MARTALTTYPFAVNGSLTDPTGTASGVGAGNGITVPYQGGRSIMLRVTAGGAGTATVLAGSQPSAIASGQGNLVANFGGAGTQWLGPFESARFQQPDGSLAVDTSIAMTVTAFTLDGRYVG